MFKENEKIYYIDTREGTIHSARFNELTVDGAWITIKGDAVNTFVYKDKCEVVLFPTLAEAQTGLDNYKSRLKAKLIEDNNYRKDLIKRLQKHEGALYAEIISDILNDMIN